MKPRPIPPAASECCCKFCCDQTMVELLLVSFLEERAGRWRQGDRWSGPAKSSMCIGRPINTLRQVGLKSKVHASKQVGNKKFILHVVCCASLLRVCWSFSEGLTVDVPALDRNAPTCQTICTLASRCGGCRRIDGDTKVRATFFSTVATRSVQTSTNVSCLRCGFTSVRAPSTLAARTPTVDLRCVPSGLPRFLQTRA